MLIIIYLIAIDKVQRDYKCFFYRQKFIISKYYIFRIAKCYK